MDLNKSSYKSLDWFYWEFDVYPQNVGAEGQMALIGYNQSGYPQNHPFEVLWYDAISTQWDFYGQAQAGDDCFNKLLGAIGRNQLTHFKITYNISNNTIAIWANSTFTTCKETKYAFTNVTDLLMHGDSSVLNGPNFKVDNVIDNIQLWTRGDMQPTGYNPTTSTCNCPTSGDWIISDGSDCNLVSSCYLATNNLFITNGKLRINGNGLLQANKCVINQANGILTSNIAGSKLICHGS
jgi:hypothetical protein